MAARHVDRALAGDEHFLLFALGAAEHMTTDDTIGDVDEGGHLRGAHLTAAIHIAFHLTAAYAHGGVVAGVVVTILSVSHGTVLAAAIDGAIDGTAFDGHCSAACDVSALNR